MTQNAVTPSYIVTHKLKNNENEISEGQEMGFESDTWYGYFQNLNSIKNKV